MTAPSQQESRCPIAVTEAAEANEVLRNRQFRLPEIAPYLERLQAASGKDFSRLISVARSSLIFQPDSDHQKSRGVIARFFRETSLMAWGPQIDLAIADSLDRLQTSAAPDLVQDLTDPLFVSLVQKIFGLRVVDQAAFIEQVNNARQITEPLLPLRRILVLQDAFAAVMAVIPEPQKPFASPQGPRTLPQTLCDEARELPSYIDRKALIASLAVACHTLAESLAFILWGLLQERRAAWQALADPAIVEARLPGLLAHYASTLTLFRQADQGTALGGCPLGEGQLIALNMPRIRLSTDPQRGDASLSFGAGPHRCPGAALSEVVLRRALPAIARRFPDLRLELDKAVLHRTQIIQSPTTLPCQGIKGSRRTAARLWEIHDRQTAQAIVTDDRLFGPPTMVEHLSGLQQASGHDLSVAHLFARNAMFFMSGPRHQALRQAVTSVLGANRLPVWGGMIDGVLDRVLDNMDAKTSCDLVSAFCQPILYGAIQPILGLIPHEPERFNALAPQLQKVLKPLLSLRDILRLQEVLGTLLDLCRRPATEHQRAPDQPQSLLERLLLQPPDGMSTDDSLALVMVLYGASFNLSFTLSNALYTLLRLPPDQRMQAADPQWVGAQMERLILPAAAAPKFIYRLARQAATVGGLSFAKGDTLQIHLADVNPRGEAGHLAFGHGLHHCVGASLSRLVIGKAIPAFFARFPDACLDQLTPTYENNSQTLAPASLVCSFSSSKS